MEYMRVCNHPRITRSTRSIPATYSNPAGGLMHCPLNLNRASKAEPPVKVRDTITIRWECCGSSSASSTVANTIRLECCVSSSAFRTVAKRSFRNVKTGIIILR